MVLMCHPPRACLFDKTNRQSRSWLGNAFATKQSVCPREIRAADHVKILQLKIPRSFEREILRPGASVFAHARQPERFRNIEHYDIVGPFRANGVEIV
jgi:hypothetical protein